MPCNTLLEFVTLVWIINSGKAYVDRHQEGGNGKACSDPGAVKRYSWNMEETVDSGNTSTDGTWFWRTYEMPHGTSKPYVTHASKHTSVWHYMRIHSIYHLGVELLFRSITIELCLYTQLSHLSVLLWDCEHSERSFYMRAIKPVFAINVITIKHIPIKIIYSLDLFYNFSKLS